MKWPSERCGDVAEQRVLEEASCARAGHCGAGEQKKGLSRQEATSLRLRDWMRSELLVGGEWNASNTK